MHLFLFNHLYISFIYLLLIGVSAVIFVASISEFDQILFEDSTTNRMVRTYVCVSTYSHLHLNALYESTCMYAYICLQFSPHSVFHFFWLSFSLIPHFCFQRRLLFLLYFYYPTSFITKFSLSSCQLFFLPSSSFPSLSSLPFITFAFLFFYFSSPLFFVPFYFFSNLFHFFLFLFSFSFSFLGWSIEFIRRHMQ